MGYMHFLKYTKYVFIWLVKKTLLFMRDHPAPTGQWQVIACGRLSYKQSKLTMHHKTYC